MDFFKAVNNLLDVFQILRVCGLYHFGGLLYFCWRRCFLPENLRADSTGKESSVGEIARDPFLVRVGEGGVCENNLRDFSCQFGCSHTVENGLSKDCGDSKIDSILCGDFTIATANILSDVLWRTACGGGDLGDCLAYTAAYRRLEFGSYGVHKRHRGNCADHSLCSAFGDVCDWANDVGQGFLAVNGRRLSLFTYRRKLVVAGRCETCVLVQALNKFFRSFCERGNGVFYQPYREPCEVPRRIADSSL